MVTIKKGTLRPLRVSKKAYENFYKSAGWKIVGVDSKQNEEKKTTSGDSLEMKMSGQNSSQFAEEDEEGEEDEWAEFDDEVTKPLSEMNRTELEEYATKLGVDLAGLTTNKQYREAIKQALAK